MVVEVELSSLFSRFVDHSIPQYSWVITSTFTYNISYEVVVIIIPTVEIWRYVYILVVGCMHSTITSE